MALPTSAQELGTAVINGDVTDPQGAVVRNATVTAENKSTGSKRSTITNSAGIFAFNNLAPGSYELRVNAPGFAGFISQLRLEIGQQANVKTRLSVASQQTVIEVGGSNAIPAVNTVSSVVDGVVDSHQIDNLPLNGRNFIELALLMPGNSPAPNFDPTKTNTVVISSAGQLGRGSSVTIDGSDDNDDAVGGMLLNLPEDAVQEFQIATNRFSAESGRTASGVVNVVTKSGTNALHGTASVYERDKALQALPATFDPNSVPGETPPFSRQQYSGTLGGPLVKDRAWWFGGFEYRDELGGVLAGTRDLAAQTITKSFATAPLNDLLGTVRGDWQTSAADQLTFRYSLERMNGTGASTLNTSLGSASERQDLRNNFQAFSTSWARVISPTLLNKFSFSVNNFINITDPVTPGAQLDFPSLTDGASYRVPQQTTQNRLQWDDGIDWTHGKHNFRFGGQFQRIDDSFFLGVFQAGRVELLEDFAPYDRNRDGVVNDQDLLFAVTIRSANPTQPLNIPNADNNFVAAYVQDDWHVHPQLTLNLGLRYEIDTDVNNVGHYNQLNPILRPFLHGNRHKDANNFGPRVGFNWAPRSQFSMHGGYGIYYDRVTLEVLSLERGLDGRALPIDVRLGNVAFLDSTGHFVPGAPTLANPFSGPIIPGAGAAEGMDVISNQLQNPMVQQFNLGIQWEPVANWIVRADGIHNLGTHFIIGRPVGAVFNPVVGGPEGVTQIESSVNTHYDALWLSVDRRFAQRYQFHGAYTLSKALNYANDDQIPFAYPPIDPNNLHREYGPAPNDQRHRLVLQGVIDLPFGFRASPIWTYASGVPMDILLGDGSAMRVPQLARNAGGRQFHSGAELNAYIAQLNAAGATNGSLGSPLPMVDNNAHFSDTFNSFDLRISKTFRLGERISVEALGEVFNLANKTNILGVSTTNYSGFFNALVPDANNPLHSSAFGRPVTTAGGIFGSGGPRAFQLGAKLSF
ncbi:MAG TPA: TonB-dependent receptor [Terriglobales bacterium]|nr:TonB-dependent receptor [Terriglobales bacterium]